MWRFGTFRRDAVRRLNVPELGVGVEEVAFALADERNEMVQFFFAAAEEHSRAAKEGSSMHTTRAAAKGEL
jgi:LysR family transcriptional regulator, low CO2-responsive transcriptional regulator